ATPIRASVAIVPPSPRRAAVRAAVAVPAGALAILALLALAAPALAPYDPARQFDLVTMANQGPSAEHPLGTDPFARDLLSRTVYAARVSLQVGLLAALVAVTLGAAWGAVAGAAGRRLDAFMMRLVDVGLGVPRVLLLLVVVALWGSLPPSVLAVVVGALSWLGTSRLVRERVRAAHARDFALAATALGASPLRVLARHVAPHALGTLAVSGSLIFGEVIAIEAGLSFMGLGVRPPTASWGSMIMDGQPVLLVAPWTAGVAIACVGVTVLAASTLGDALRDRFDPRDGAPR
ncbi:ABC transporter permease, partial [Roseisolibacter sp. H3M3-2]|uniref:ABC transporter permease n=1 Tax=Roseisolibacter sp. H3M3-2 TaxID=3031323 RepID=UPI0023DC1F98